MMRININCLLLIVMFILSSVAYASSIYYCPASVKCTEKNKASSCSVSSNASLWKLDEHANSLNEGKYDLVMVTNLVVNSKGGIQCFYNQSPKTNETNWIKFTSTSTLYIPKTDIPNQWNMRDVPVCPKEYNDTKISPTICPFQF